MKVIDAIVGYVLLIVVMGAAGLAVVQYFGGAVELPAWAKDWGVFAGAAAGVYVLWQVIADGIAAWREAGGVGFTLKFIRRVLVGFVQSVVAPGLAAVAAVSGSWNILKEVGETYGDGARVAATSAVMLAAASLAIISKLPNSEPKPK